MYRGSGNIGWGVGIGSVVILEEGRYKFSGNIGGR